MSEFDSPPSKQQQQQHQQCYNQGDNDHHLKDEDLSAQFDSLNIESETAFNDAVMKRGYDHLTIEGSPFHSHVKRLDTHPTPSYPLIQPIKPQSFASPIFQRHVPVEKLDTPETPIRCQPDSDIPSSSSSTSSSSMNSVVGVIVAEGEHDTGNHQENFMRLSLLVGNETGCLRRDQLKHHVEIMDIMDRKASLADLMRVHEFTYLQHLDNKVKSTQVSKDEIAKPQVFPPFYAPPGQLDIDTPLGASSLEAAKSFCGAAMTAVDLIMEKANGIRKRNRLLVLGRPPGHHAGANGCVVSDYYWKRPDMTSSGFCLLNTVAVAAAYARCRYGTPNLVDGQLMPCMPPRIAIVDIDVHHGNGTEDIIRNLRPRQIHLPLPSSWAPMTQLSYKPWLNEHDADDVFFSSINLVAEDRFYPCSGSDTKESSSGNQHDTILNIGLTPIGPGPWDQKARSKLSHKDKTEYCTRASEEFRSKVTSKLLPKLRSFRPDVIFISAGFDAHVDDYYHFLTEKDYHWITSELIKISDENDGAVISVLEGGYSLSSPEPPATRTTKNSGKSTATATASQSNESTQFAQKPGDGGLVKGVLAHVAALASKTSWTD